MNTARPLRNALQALVFGFSLACSAVPVQARDLLVFAAASLKNALDDTAAAWSRKTGKTAVISYAASNMLAKQIEAGAPADIFFSADSDWMHELSAKGLIKPESRVDLLGNSLVLIASKNAAVPFMGLESFRPMPSISDLPSILGAGRLAMANVDAVPAGKYGKDALENFALWQSVKDKLVQTENVRMALALVSRGEAQLGIVYKTDAASDPNVKVVFSFPLYSYTPIVYPVALTKESRNPDAPSFLAFLRSEEASLLFKRQGFNVLTSPGSAP